MTYLETKLRARLENAVKDARVMAERGARQALQALAVDRREAHSLMTAEQRSLRNRLRAHGRQLGDVRDPSGGQTIDRLVREVAYEHWHRMLFARFLAENDLLIEPVSGVAVTLEECEELARERGEDTWELAASFAQEMLPQIFRVEEPSLRVKLPPETRQALQRLLADLPATVFTADDALGWTYQFWQSAEKDAVNARVKSGEKITGETLPAVTQLFTEPYMVKFLLHNTIGAWHTGRTLSAEQRERAASESELRAAVRLTSAGGYDFEYLRFVREPAADGQDDVACAWRPAAGMFEGWPRHARELTILDPCCGSGHFLVEAFHLLARLRMQEEGMDAGAAARAVIRENLFGLELDARCTQIAAFNLALAVWKLAGKRIDLPRMRLACSGIGPRTSKEEWLRLAEEAAAASGMPAERDLFGTEDTLLSAGVRGGLEALYDLFDKAPELGSLIDPRGGAQLDALRFDFQTLEPLMDAILRREGVDQDFAERAVAAKGMAEAARILIGPPGGYTLVITNVPYRKRAHHNDFLKVWADTHHRQARNDLATVFLSRMLRWINACSQPNFGTVAAVTPHNWLFLTTYRRFRERLLKAQRWEVVARLGPGAFETIGGEVVKPALVILCGANADEAHLAAGLDVLDAKGAATKAALLRGQDIGDFSAVGQTGRSGAESPADDWRHEASDGRGSADGNVRLFSQPQQLKNPDARVSLGDSRSGRLLSHAARYGKGSTTGDKPRFLLRYWELSSISASVVKWLDSPSKMDPWSGRSLICAVSLSDEELTSQDGCRLHGHEVWGKDGVAVNKMSDLQPFLYTGEVFDDNVGVLAPHEQNMREAIWAFCESGEYREAVRQIDQALKVTAATLVKVPFDVSRWRNEAEERYPNGLPEPYSDDPTQWLFHGHPARADPGTELHVAVARLLGYSWPAELDPEMRLSEDARALIERARDLDALGLSDSDGIVCIPPVRGEASAADRLRALLGAAYGSAWSGARERELLAAAAAASHGTGRRAASLEEWLRESFFEEHCKLFHHRPFIWHVWDGRRDGFGALVNYHRLAGAEGVGRRTLDSLTFAYLGEWIDNQRAERNAVKEGADGRLTAALRLQAELEKILEGEPPYDIFVRWKPLHEQALGCEPDINDGVRLNIRPFLFAEDLGRRGAGILRWKPNVAWGKDRGKEPESLRPREDFPWFWGCDPEKEPAHGTDFGAPVPGTPVAGEKFDGIRWNALHYTRAAKEAARERAAVPSGVRE